MLARLARRMRSALKIWRDTGWTGIRIVAARRLEGLADRVRPDATQSSYGPQFLTRTGDRTFRLYVSGRYGRWLWNRISRINRRFDFLDIGANQGLYSICAAQNRKCRKVIALEPVADTARLLRLNLLLNRAHRRSTVLQAALSDVGGRATLRVPGNHSGRATLAGGNDGDGPEWSEQQVKTISHKGLAPYLPLNGPPLMVKIDVEGHEDIVVSELFKATCAPRIAWIVCEVTPAWTDTHRLMERLRAAGFSLTKMGGERQFEILAERKTDQP